MKEEKKLTRTEREFIRLVIEKLPPIIARNQISLFLGGIVAPQTLANADACGEGPKGAYKIGKKVVYSAESLLNWIVARYGIESMKNNKSA